MPEIGTSGSWRAVRQENPEPLTVIIPCSDLAQTSNKIIQKGLAFVCERSGTATVPGTGVPRDPAPPAAWPRWGCGGGGKRRRTNAMEDSDGKTDRYAAHHSVRGFAAR